MRLPITNSSHFPYAQKKVMMENIKHGPKLSLRIQYCESGHRQWNLYSPVGIELNCGSFVSKVYPDRYHLIILLFQSRAQRPSLSLGENCENLHTCKMRSKYNSFIALLGWRHVPGNRNTIEQCRSYSFIWLVNTFLGTSIKSEGCNWQERNFGNTAVKGACRNKTKKKALLSRPAS